MSKASYSQNDFTIIKLVSGEKGTTAHSTIILLVLLRLEIKQNQGLILIEFHKNIDLKRKFFFMLGNLNLNIVF